MNLSDYAISKGGTATIECPVLAAIAEKIGCSPATLYMIAKDHKKGSAKLTLKIETETGFEVTRYDLRPDIFGPAPAGQKAA